MTRLPLYSLFYGICLASLAPSTALAAFPLKSTHVDVHIAGPVAELTIEQTFSNTYEDFIEATYVFPLHDEAAVDGAVMRIGEREIRAQIHPREEAREIYEAARDEGHTAALTEQERPNIFTQSVANIPPGQEISVLLHVVQPVSYEDGVYRFDFPLVVGPRFIPASQDPADALRISPPVLPTTAADDQGIAHRVTIEMDIDMGLSLASVTSTSHPGTEIRVEGDRAWVQLDHARADSDFVVEIDPDVAEPALSFLAQDGHFSLLLEPQPEPAPVEVVPRELVFIVDNSCSMSGTPMNMAKEAMREALRGLLPSDSFQVIRFSEAASKLAAAPLPATPENIARGLAYVDGMAGMGGTHMLAGIQAALGYEASSSPDGRGRRQRIVSLMTDGYIGNDREILAYIADNIGDSRMFSFGIGSSVNRYLLSRAADIGRGHATWVLLHESPEGKVEEFYERIARPVLTDIEIDWGSMNVSEVYPAVTPDLFSGQPLRFTGRYTGDPGVITVKGRTGQGRYEERVELDVLDGGEAIPSTWARAKVNELEQSQLWGEVDDVKDEIVETALQYRILTQYTSFVAVERRVRNTSGTSLSLEQPLEIPAGVDFDATVSEISRRAMRPGDPLLTVEAPADAQSVAAVFPWGEVAELRWDDVRGRWYHRFLVPRGTEEGPCEVEITILHADGSVEVVTEQLDVDASAPELDVEVVWTPEGTLVRVILDEPLRSLHIFPAGSPEDRVRIDLRKPEWADAEVVEVLLDGRVEGVTVVAKDPALNRIEQTIDVATGLVVEQRVTAGGAQ